MSKTTAISRSLWAGLAKWPITLLFVFACEDPTSLPVSGESSTPVPTTVPAPDAGTSNSAGTPPAPSSTGSSAPAPTAPQPAPTPTQPAPTPVPTSSNSLPSAAPPRQLHGVTIDSIDNLGQIVNSLKSHAKRPTVRIVFDENVPASEYVTATTKISPVADIMGEVLDSFYVKDIDVNGYLDRTREYLTTLGTRVSIWEIGNEINGEWLGNTTDVAAKMSGAYKIVKGAGKVTALTLYYNQDCWERASNEMFTWAAKNVPQDMKSGLDYVLISYYEDDCNGLQPDWQSVYTKLAAMFPNALLGFGEVGTDHADRKEAYIRRYYGMQINQPRYVGGYFWWYYYQDAVPSTKPLWSIFDQEFKTY